MEIKKSVKELDCSNIQLDVTVAKSDVKEMYTSVIDNYAKTVQIAGFRKGKVPVSILEQRYGKGLRLEVGSDIIEKALTEIFETADKSIKPLGYDQPELIGEINLDPECDFTFSVKYDVFPKVNLQKIDGFSIKVPKITDESALLEEELKQIQYNNSFVRDRKDGETAVSGDTVTITYCELDENKNVISGTERQDFTFEIGSELNIYKIDNELIGMKKGEEKIISKTYPEDFQDTSLAGTTKCIKVTLTALKFRELPNIDDELAQDVSEKYKTLDDLKTDITKRISTAIEERIRELKVDAFLTNVVTENDFLLPQSMVQADLQLRWKNIARQMGVSVEKLDSIMNREDSGLSKNTFFDNSKPEAEKELKKRVVIETLMDLHPEIVASDEDYELEYKHIAETSNMKLEDVKERYATDMYKTYLTDIIKERKLFDIVLANCKMEQGDTISASDFFKHKEH